MSDGFYKSLIEEGVSIQQLLRNNSGNVGAVGELLELAADKIDELESVKSSACEALDKLVDVFYEPEKSAISIKHAIVQVKQTLFT